MGDMVNWGKVKEEDCAKTQLKWSNTTKRSQHVKEKVVYCHKKRLINLEDKDIKFYKLISYYHCT